MAKPSALYRINQISAVFMVIWVCWPWFCQNTGLVGGILIAGLWCITAVLLKPIRTVGIGELALVFYAIYMFMSYFMFGKVYANYPMYYYLSMVMLFFLSYYVFQFYVNQDALSFLGKLAIVAIICMIIGSITSSLYTYLSPNIMKTISQTLDTKYVQFRKAGIGSFGFIYMMVLAIPAVIGNLKSKNHPNKLITALIIIFCICGLKCIIDSTFTTAMLISVGGVFLVFISSRKSASLNVIIYLTTFFAFILFSRVVGNILINITVESADVTTRLHEIGNLLLGNEGGTNTDGRMEHLRQSIECFFAYPLFGYNFTTNPTHTMGGHCEWIDIFATYGIVGGIPIIFAILDKIKKVASNVKNKIGDPFYGIIIFLFVIYGFLDPFLRLYNLGFAIFFLVPSISCIPKAFPKKGAKQ